MPYAPTTTLANDDVFSKDKINSYILLPLADLISPPAAIYYKPSTDPNLTTASTTMVAMDDTLGNFWLNITSRGNPVLLGFRANVSNSTASAIIRIDIEVDGALYNGSTNGIYQKVLPASAGVLDGVFFQEIMTLAAGSHDFKMRWSVNTGTGTINSLGKTIFFVREL